MSTSASPRTLNPAFRERLKMALEVEPARAVQPAEAEAARRDHGERALALFVFPVKVTSRCLAEMVSKRKNHEL